MRNDAWLVVQISYVGLTHIHICYPVTEKSLRWMFNHHIDWDGPVALNVKGPACGRWAGALLRTLWHKSV